jgi:hypothetical protein
MRRRLPSEMSGGGVERPFGNEHRARRPFGNELGWGGVGEVGVQCRLRAVWSALVEKWAIFTRDYKIKD